MNKTTLTSMQKAQKGVGLVEILVTILITVIGLVGLASMQLKSVRANQKSSQKSQAIWILSDLANRMRANSRGNYATSANGFDCPNPPVAPARVCSPPYPTAQVTQPNCTANQLATFDIQEILCGSGSSSATYRGAASFLANPSLNIQTISGNNLRITLSWSVRQEENSNSTTEQLQMVIYR